MRRSFLVGKRIKKVSLYMNKMSPLGGKKDRKKVKETENKRRRKRGKGSEANRKGGKKNLKREREECEMIRGVSVSEIDKTRSP